MANLRFDAARVIRLITKHLRVLYQADACSLIQSQQFTAVYSSHCKGHYGAKVAVSTDPIVRSLTQKLDTLPAAQVIVSCGASHRWKWWCPWARTPVYDVLKDERTAGSQEVREFLTTLRNKKSFVLVPVPQRGETVAHLYLAARRRHAFSVSDIDSLLQFTEPIMPLLDNIQLVADAAEEERWRIARDLHDSVVQSYFGLQIGLTALHQKLAAGGADVRGDVAHLIELADDGVADLCRYILGLKDGNEFAGDLLSAVEHFAAKFAKAAGIAVHVEAETDIRVSDRLAAEVFHMVTEGLSNIRRHTNAARAIIGLACGESHLLLRIENDSSDGWVPFTPRSITERAATLGGHAHVERREDNGTAVLVTIPL